jgi:trans-aconitate methyltransferase
MDAVSDWNASSIRHLENQSIQQFLEHCGEFIKGRVLDYGCGDQRYRNLVESFDARYQGYDRAQYPGSVTKGKDIGGDNVLVVTWDTILCTQVMQFVPDPPDLLHEMHGALRDKGHLVMTYPTNWCEQEDGDFFRFTKQGMEYLLTEVGFTVVRHERRADIDVGGFVFSLGGGVVAKA